MNTFMAHGYLDLLVNIPRDLHLMMSFQPDSKASHLTEMECYLFDSIYLRLWICEESV